jgi:hypothetical protein
MREGWTKNLALLFAHPRTLAWLRAAESVLILGNAVATVVLFSLGRNEIATSTLLLALVMAGFSWMRIRRAHFRASSNLLAPVGLPLFSYLLVRSAKLHREGRVTWKGRRYGIPLRGADHPRREISSDTRQSPEQHASGFRIDRTESLGLPHPQS